MKKALIVIVATAMLVGALAAPARAGDREWAIAGKVLVGLAVLDAIAEPCRPAPIVYHQPVYPAPVVVHRPVIYPRPVVYPRPVIVHPPVVYTRPAYCPPRVIHRRPHFRPPVYRTGYGHGPRGGHHRR
jgi:hypothetical protein